MSVDSPDDPKYLVKKLVPVVDYTDGWYAALPDDERRNVVVVKGKWYRTEDLPPGEPVFVLRAQDVLAEACVRIYAGMRMGHDLEHGEVSPGAYAALAHGDEFGKWSRKKFPT